ncbi:MAG: Stk1 family PASTA domain-containing Ser/Thr kinase [Actinomycetota bacterium]
MSDNRLYGGRYEVTGRVASGGMAEVFVARDRLLGRSVAVKVLHPEFARDRSFIERFRREAQAAASLNDPRVVSIYDWGSDDGTYYIVMEYVQGRSLRDIIEAEGPLPPEQAADIAADVCAALDFAHRHGIVHRDVKPANIMITPSGQTKVTDFGIARQSLDPGQTVTQTGTVIGTASYLSPEQAQGMPVDARSDVYSVGVVLYEMLTREVPFKADTPVAVAYKHVKEDPVPPSRLNPQVTPELDAIALRAMAKNPDNRYLSAEEMRLDLERALVGDPVEATPLLPPDQTAMFQPADRTTVLPAPPLPASRARRKAVAYALIGLMFVGILVAVVALVFSAFFGGGTGKTVEVPNVAGKTLLDAQRQLDSAGLRSRVDRYEFNEQTPDTVIGQDPEDGRKVPGSSLVLLVVSKGPEQVEVPELRNKTLEEATKALDDLGLKVGATPRQFSLDIEEGRVLEQDPRPRERVDPGGSVDLVLSAGKEQATVPNVRGVSEQKAREALLDAGLNVSTKDFCDTGAAPGIVLEQSPAAGTKIPKGDNVEITVNRARQVPGVVGQTEASAKSELEAAGFRTTSVYRDNVPLVQDRVFKTDPDVGEVACPGDFVTLTVESGPTSSPTPTSSPSVTPSPSP